MYRKVNPSGVQRCLFWSVVYDLFLVSESQICFAASRDTCLTQRKEKKKKEKKASLVAMMLQRSFWPPTAHRNCGHTDLLSFGYPILPSMLTNHFACSVYSRYFETQELTAVSLILD